MARVTSVPSRDEQLALEPSVPAEARAGLAAGAAHFDAREFWDAHEAWEEVWQAEKRPIRGFYQGLILVAAGLHHWTRSHRPRGVQLKLQQGMERLQPYRPTYLGVDVDAVIALAGRLRAEAGGHDAAWLAATPLDHFPPLPRVS